MGIHVTDLQTIKSLPPSFCTVLVYRTLFCQIKFYIFYDILDFSMLKASLRKEKIIKDAMNTRKLRKEKTRLKILTVTSELIRKHGVENFR